LTDRKPEKSNEAGEPAWRWFAQTLFSLIRQFGNTVIWAAVCMYAITQIGETLRAFAGKTSAANLLLSIAAHVSLTVGVSVAVSVGMTGMYLYEYRRHRKTRERLTVRITELETRLDPKRSTSGISTQGTTLTGDL
jgi:sensor c-di-GMP phosphodiesterase-like protein